MSVAIFSALQDTRAGVARIETTLEGLPTNLETVCRTSTKEAIHEVIDELKAEAYAVGSGAADGKGFSNGEAEKIISQVSTGRYRDVGRKQLTKQCHPARRPTRRTRAIEGGRRAPPHVYLPNPRPRSFTRCTDPVRPRFGTVTVLGGSGRAVRAVRFAAELHFQPSPFTDDADQYSNDL